MSTDSNGLGSLPKRSRDVRLALYGDVDLNILDGSAVWLASLAQTLAGGGFVDVTLLTKAPIKRPLLVAPLRGLARVRILEPGQAPGTRAERLTPAKALDALEALDAAEGFDAFVLRGFALCRAAADRPALRGRFWAYLTDVPQRAADLTPEILAELETVCAGAGRVLCQTEELRGFLEAHVEATRGRATLLPPMIPPGARPGGLQDAPADGGRATDRAVSEDRAVSADGAADERPLRRIAYAGKFAPLWGTLEMFEAFCRARAVRPDLELHVFGDKIHDPKDDPTFKPTVAKALKGTPGLVWHQGLTREEVIAALAGMDLAWSWRLPALDASLELSTKVLEYGAAGLPVLLNRNPMNVGLLGSDYPLFAGSVDEVVALLTADGGADAFRLAADRAYDRSRGHTFERVFADHLAPPLSRLAPLAVPQGTERPTILVAGHDLRFIRALLEPLRRLGREVLLDTWQGHARHDAAESRRLLDRADVIVCEWALGNAVWYAKHKKPGQRLVVRFHRQELETGYPADLDIDQVDQVLFVGPHILEEAASRFGWPEDKLAFVPNYVETDQLHRPKLEGATFNLGLAGFCPSMKRLDRALDVLERLRADDERYVLYVKGKRPWEYEWLWARDAERAWYQAVFARIERSPLLRRSVVFDGFGADVASWYRKIGFVLSPSDFESFHLAVAEGAASGAVPFTFGWPGADRIYPASWSRHSAQGVAEAIRETVEGGALPARRDEVRTFVHQRFSLERVAEAWRALLTPET